MVGSVVPMDVSGHTVGTRPSHRRNARTLMLKTRVIVGEVWKKHPSYDVEVSNLGRVRRNNKIKKLSHKIYKSQHRDIHYHVTIAGARRSPIRRVGRLVLESFKGPCPEGFECRHLNGKSLDDRLDNLKWGTRKEQIQDQKDHGTFSPPPVLRGRANPAYKWGPEVYARAAKLRSRGLSHMAISRLVGISKSQLMRRI